MQSSNIGRFSRYILKISRPRFWLYLAGPVLIGLGGNLDMYSIYLLLFFMLPANIFLYGVNDLYDRRTDALNVKKSMRETRITSREDVKTLRIAILTSILLSIPLFVLGTAVVRLLFGLFFFLSFAYSAPPLRFKAKPYLDSMSNILYVVPGIISYVYAHGSVPEVKNITAAALWTWAMHLFSAVPDIEPDNKAGIQTTAVVLGKQRSLLLCVVYWGLATILVSSYPIVMLIGLVYVCIPAVLYLKRASTHTISEVYWKFPLLNGIVGFGLYLYNLFVI